MKKITFILFFILVNTTLKAQDFKLGKVSVKELEEKIHPIDSSAVAAILYKKGSTKFALNSSSHFELVTEVEIRIKIYKKEGLKYANFVIPYYSGRKNESLSFNDAVTYNLVNGKVDKTRANKEGEFDEKINEAWSHKKIVFPNVKEGSVIELKYTHKTPHLSSVDDWYFQHDIPVNKVWYDIFIPHYFVYRINLNSTDVILKQDMKAVTASHIFNQTTSYGNKAGGSELGYISYNEYRYFYSAENLPALADEEYVDNIKNYVACVKHELVKTQFPDGIKDYSITWNDVAKTIYSRDNFGKELKQSNYFEDELKQILPVGLSGQKKVDTIFNFVKNKMVWNNKYGYLCNAGVKKAYKSGVGNVAEINLMLTKMLQYAGLDANPVLLSTRDNGFFTFPGMDAFNYVISSVRLNDGKIILLDATDKYTTPNILPIRAINRKGRIIREDGRTEEVSLISDKHSKKTVFGVVNLKENGKFSGQFRHVYHDYMGYIFRNSYSGVSNNTYIENLEKRYGGIEIEDGYERTNEQNLTQPVIEVFSIDTDNMVDIIGDKLYFSPMLYYKRLKNPFTKEKRNYPIDFIFPFHEKYYLSFSIPENFQIEFIPDSFHITLPDDLGFYKFIVENKGSQIRVSVDYLINTAVIPEKYYFELSNFFKQMIEKESDKIVLKRI